MTALTGRTPKDTYKDLLQVSNANQGIDGAVDFRFGENALDVLAGSTLRLDRGATLAVEAGAAVSGLGTVPTGMVAPFAGAAAPDGWLLCAGQAVSRTAYAALFAAIGETHGAGDGRTTFHLPDLRGRAVAGLDDMGGSAAGRLTNRSGGVDGDRLGAAGGSETATAPLPAHTHGPGTLTAAQAGSHTHDTRVGDIRNGGIRNQEGGVSGVYGGRTSSAGSHTHPITGRTASEGAGGAHNNVQPTIVLNWIVKT